MFAIIFPSYLATKCVINDTLPYCIYFVIAFSDLSVQNPSNTQCNYVCIVFR